MKKAYDRVYYHGKLMNRRTMEMVKKAEKALGYELTIVQGSYNAGRVGASAGTHDGGGALDLTAWDWQSKVRVLRRVGFAAWYRPAIPGLWGSHVHAIAIGDKELAPSARRQVDAYYAGRDGLASNGRDPHPRPNPQPVFRFNKPTYWVDLSNVTAQFKKATKSLPGVKRIQRSLNAKRGEKLLVDGKAGPATKAAYKRYQRSLGYRGKDADGIPGMTSLRNLGRNRFKVRK